MADEAHEQRGDERLRELLAVENRLQNLVRAAEESAALRIAAAREARDQRLIEAQGAAAHADAARSREERVAHEQALKAIANDHERALAAIAAVSGERIDELARWALGQVIDASGDAT